MTQVQTIEKHLKEYGSITAREAMIKYEIYRLASRAMEMGLISTMEKKNGKRYARYSL